MTATLAKVLRVSPESLEEAIDAAVRVLSRGGIVALPTDTIYGISTLMEYSDKLYQLKRRPQIKPLGLFLPSVDQISHFAHLTVPLAVAEQLLPGPVTLLFERNQNLPASFNPGVSNIGVRVPNSILVQSICARIGQPLAQTSANISGAALNPVCVEDFEELWPEIDLVIDGGEIASKSSAGSTIVDLSREGNYHIVRDGCAMEATQEILVNAGLDPL